MIPPSLVLGTIGIAGGLVGAVCVSHAVPADNSTQSQQHALGTPGNGDGSSRVFGIPVRTPSGPMITSALVSTAPGEYLSKHDLGATTTPRILTRIGTEMSSSVC